MLFPKWNCDSPEWSTLRYYYLTPLFFSRGGNRSRRVISCRRKDVTRMTSRLKASIYMRESTSKNFRNFLRSYRACGFTVYCDVVILYFLRFRYCQLKKTMKGGKHMGLPNHFPRACQQHTLLKGRVRR